ncbi:MAG TPA: PASTA domain-containing protein, partial [Umezawaea sp.]|nr:PASTA domain-containing protein [Umezawaea sp.]
MPDLVGLFVHVARSVGHEAGVVVTARDPDGPPLGALTWPGHWLVTGQDPDPGERVPRGAAVAIDFEEYRDGDAGDREPRRPPPEPRVRR